MENAENEATLEERAECRLFSQRSIDAIAKHKDTEFAYDDDRIIELTSAIGTLIDNDTPAVIAELVRAVVSVTLINRPDVLARLLADLGAALDDALRAIEHAMVEDQG